MKPGHVRKRGRNAHNGIDRVLARKSHKVILEPHCFSRDSCFACVRQQGYIEAPELLG